MRQNLNRKQVSLLGCVGLIFCASLMAVRGDEERPMAKPSPRLEKYLGQRVVSILKETTKIEALRVDFETQRDWSKGQATQLDKDFAAKLESVLLDDNTYRWEKGNPNPIGLKCIFRPAVAYRFWKNEESVSVLVCFKCGEVKFASDNPEDRSDPFRRAIAAKLRPEIVTLTKRAFPDDKDIQSLKD